MDEIWELFISNGRDLEPEDVQDKVESKLLRSISAL
jgi:hypothetical protein